MSNLIDRNELYKALSQWEWQDLYLPVHFKELVDELPAVDGGYTEGDIRDTYNDGYSTGIQRGYEDAVLHYAKMALKQWIPCSERLPEEYEVLCCNTHKDLLIGHPYKDETTNTGFSAESEGEYLFDCIAWMPLPEPI